MKFVLKQEKLENMLEKIMVKDMFPVSTITVKDKMLYSIEKEEHGRALRFIKFKANYFDSIEDGSESIRLDVERCLGTIKNILPNILLTVETKGNKLSITGKNIDANISFEEPSDVIDSLEKTNMQIKDGSPIVGEGKVKLETHLLIKLPDFKDVAGYASSLKTEFYKFYFDKDRIAVRVGDLHDFSDYVIYNPDGEIKKGKEYESIYTYGIPQIAETFDKDVNIQSKSNSPAWIFEGSKEHVFGLLIPPYEKD